MSNKMVGIVKDELIFEFSDLHKDAVCKIHFERLVDVPSKSIAFLGEDQKEVSCLIGMGRFPLNFINDSSVTIPKNWLDKDACFLSIYEFEKLSIRINQGYPMAVSIWKGGLNIFSGETWRNECFTNTGNYIVSDKQPWLNRLTEGTLGIDICVKQLLESINEDECIDLQFIVSPMKAVIYDEIIATKKVSGILLLQDIDESYFAPDVWETRLCEKMHVHITTARTYKKITGGAPA